MNDSTPRLTRSHAAEESEGGLFGIPTRTLLWMAPMLVLAAALFLLLVRRMGIVPAALRTIVPVLILFGVTRVMAGGGPSGFLVDQLRALFSKADATPLQRSRHPGNRLFTPFPDGYVEDGTLVFGGLQGQVSGGFWIDLPDLRNASPGERNRMQDAWSAIWRQLPEGWSCQLLAVEDDRELVPRLSHYAEATRQLKNPTVRRLRDANFVHLWGMLEQGALRRRRLVLFVGHPFPSGGATEAAQVAHARDTFRNWGVTLQQVLELVGGRCTPLDSREIIHLWAETLNPSLRKERMFDPAAHFDFQGSLLDNLWGSELRAAPGGGFVLDGVHHLALTLKRLPSETFPGISQHLTQLGFPGITVCLQVRRLSKEPLLQRAQQKLERIHRQQLQKPDPRLAVSQAQLESKIQRLAAQGVVPMEAELVVLVRAATAAELTDRVAAVKAAVHRMQGAQAFEASLPHSSRSLFAKSLPGWMWSPHQGHRHHLEDPTAADLVPWVSAFAGYPGPTDCLFPGADGGLVNVVTSLPSGSIATPQHTVVLGATGAGKSVVMTKILIETAEEVAFTAIVENGLSQAAFTRAMGAEPLVFRPNGIQTLNFLSSHGRPRCSFFIKTTAAIVSRMVGIPADEDKARRQHALICRELSRITTEHAEDCFRRFTAERRERLLRLTTALVRRMESNPQSLVDAFDAFREEANTHPEAVAAELSAIDHASLRATEANHRVYVDDLLFADLSEEKQLTLSALREALELADEEECRWLAVLLEPFSRGNAYGNLFDGPTNVPLQESVFHVELGHIPEAARDLESILGFVAINQIRAKCLSLPRRLRKRVVIDEFSRFIAFPGGEEIVRELFEGFRKHNTQVVIIGQQYSRIADSPIKSAIVGNASAWLIFNTGSLTDIERLAADLGLSKVAQEAVSRFARPDQLSGAKYSEFLYVHTHDHQFLCGTARYTLLPTEAPSITTT